MSGKKLGWAAAIALSLIAIPLLAHHSFTAEYDPNKAIKFTGTVTMMKWENPHSWIYMDVKGADAKTLNWALETGSSTTLLRQGWSKDDLALGTVLVVDGWQARDGSPTGNVRSITFKDGKRLFAGTSNTGTN